MSTLVKRFATAVAIALTLGMVTSSTTTVSASPIPVRVAAIDSVRVPTVDVMATPSKPSVSSLAASTHKPSSTVFSSQYVKCIVGLALPAAVAAKFIAIAAIVAAVVLLRYQPQARAYVDRVLANCRQFLKG